MDVGPGSGLFTFAAGAEGYQATCVEASVDNLELLELGLTRNPDLQGRVRIVNATLGEREARPGTEDDVCVEREDAELARLFTAEDLNKKRSLPATVENHRPESIDQDGREGYGEDTGPKEEEDEEDEEVGGEEEDEG